MNTYVYFAILALALIALVALPVAVRMLKRKANSAARAAGERMGGALEERVKASNDNQATKDALILGTYLSFADATSGRAIVAGVLQSAKNAKVLGEGSWTIAHGAPDAITAAWVDDQAGGGSFRAVRAIEAFGALVSTRTWSKTLKSIAAAAQAQQVQLEERAEPLVRTDERINDEAVWIAPAAA